MDSPPIADPPFRFMVYFTNGIKPWTYPIERLPLLEEWIKQRGSDTIRKVIFFFRVSDRTYYPYGVHTFVLERDPKNFSQFRVQFYHYYTPENKCMVQSEEQNVCDFYTILYLIYRWEILSSELGKKIIDPFFKTNADGLLC